MINADEPKDPKRAYELYLYQTYTENGRPTPASLGLLAHHQLTELNGQTSEEAFKRVALPHFQAWALIEMEAIRRGILIHDYDQIQAIIPGYVKDFFDQRGSKFGALPPLFALLRSMGELEDFLIFEAAVRRAKKYFEEYYDMMASVQTLSPAQQQEVFQTAEVRKLSELSYSSKMAALEGLKTYLTKINFQRSLDEFYTGDENIRLEKKFIRILSEMARLRHYDNYINQDFKAGMSQVFDDGVGFSYIEWCQQTSDEDQKTFENRLYENMAFPDTSEPSPFRIEMTLKNQEKQLSIARSLQQKLEQKLQHIQFWQTLEIETGKRFQIFSDHARSIMGQAAGYLQSFFVTRGQLFGDMQHPLLGLLDKLSAEDYAQILTGFQKIKLAMVEMNEFIDRINDNYMLFPEVFRRKISAHQTFVKTLQNLCDKYQIEAKIDHRNHKTSREYFYDALFLKLEDMWMLSQSARKSKREELQNQKEFIYQYTSFDGEYLDDLALKIAV